MGDVEGAALSGGGGGDEAMGASDSVAEATVADDGMLLCPSTMGVYFFHVFFFGVLCLLLSPVFRRDWATVIRLGYAMHARFQRVLFRSR
jgi:hypothetical protein